MTVTPSVSLTAYEDRAGRFIFVSIPDERGRYLRTDKSVALVTCPQCGSIPGMPCRGYTGDRWSATTHHVRRSKARALFGHVLHADDILPGPPPPVPDEWMEFAA